jgi:hypothetical protein
MRIMEDRGSVSSKFPFAVFDVDVEHTVHFLPCDWVALIFILFEVGCDGWFFPSFPLSRMEIAVYGCIGPSSSLVLCVLVLFLPLFGSWCIGVYLLKFKRVFIGCIWCMMVCRRSQVIYVCMYYF